VKLARNDSGDKIAWQGGLLSVQPRIRLTRSFDQRSHTYLGYALKVRGMVGSEAREFLVAVGQGAHAEHQFQAGAAVSGDALPVPDARLETAEFYKVSKLKVGPPEAVDETTPPPLPSRDLLLRSSFLPALPSWTGAHGAVARCSAAAGGLPRARTSATCRANLRGEVLQLHLGMPDAG
jgi:hypothetical protein